MAFTDNFGNPKGLIGRLMLSGMNMGHAPMAKWGFTQFVVPSSGKIVDIGCGGGFNVKRLLERYPKAIVYGVDISEVSVNKTKATNKKYLGSRCEVYQASAAKLPFDDASIELATAFETVYFWQDIKNCFCEVYRTLKSGGCFAIINDPGDPKKEWDKMIPDMTSWKAEELEGFMIEAGFTDIKISKNKYMFSVIGFKK